MRPAACLAGPWLVSHGSRILDLLVIFLLVEAHECSAGSGPLEGKCRWLFFRNVTQNHVYWTRLSQIYGLLMHGVAWRRNVLTDTPDKLRGNHVSAIFRICTVVSSCETFFLTFFTPLWEISLIGLQNFFTTHPGCLNICITTVCSYIYRVMLGIAKQDIPSNREIQRVFIEVRLKFLKRC
jgi:hypothetical protein